MLILAGFSLLVMATMLAAAVARRHRPRVMWRRALFYVTFALFAALLVVSWRVSSAARAPVDIVRAEAGKKLFEEHGCTSCHSIGKGLVFGPDLEHVGEKYSRDVIAMFMMDSDQVYKEFGRRPLAAGNPDMPNLGVPEADARLITEYLMSLPQRDATE